MTELRNSLLADDEPGIRAGLGSVGTVLDHLNTQIAFYGTVQNQVTESTDLSQHMETQLKVRISDIEDADAAEAITELQQAKTQQDAALGARAKMMPRSLFDFLG